MKIVKVEDLHCDAGWRVNSFLKITTDEGIVGWAEYMEGYGAQGLTGIIHKLADRFLIGQDPRPIERITALLYAATRQAPGGINQHLFRGRFAGQRRNGHRRSFLSSDPFQDTGQGFAFQISVAYCAIVRSLENFPEPATFNIALRAHALRSAYNAVSRWSASI